MPIGKKSVADRLKELSEANLVLQTAYGQLAGQHDWLTALVGVYLSKIESKQISVCFTDVKNFDVKLNVVQFTKPQGQDVVTLTLLAPGVCVKHALLYPAPDKCPRCFEEEIAKIGPNNGTVQ